MAEINTNYFNQVPQEIKTQPFANVYPYATQMPQEKTLKDEFVCQHRKNGLVERLYNGIKNLTGLGTGSKKVQQAITKAENGEIDETTARNTIDKYRKSQANGEQAFGDLMSVGASGLTFFGLRKVLKMQNAEMIINKKYYDHIAEAGKEVAKAMERDGLGKIVEKIIKTGQSSKKMAIIAASVAGLAGGLTKYWTLKFNRIGSDEFKYSKKEFNGTKTVEDEAAYKFKKKTMKKERRRTNWRNFLSGTINGLMMPLSLVGGAIAGVPMYLVGNSLNRYFVGNRVEKDKSLKGYVENLKNDSITHLAVAAATAVPMVKKANYTKIFDKNIAKTIEKLKDANLKPVGEDTTGAYKELEQILFNKKEIREILNSWDSTDERIVALTKENIFAVKFKQIEGNSDELAKALKEACPATRTIEQAQAYVDKALGKGYKISKNLGTGTIAETYLATTPDGKEVCLKIVKEGISAEKINKDKEAFIEIINGLNKSKEEKDYLIRNIEDLANGILKEVDFKNEMEAAQKLVKYTKTANVVKPIEVKNGIYVMEKAKGISLESFVKMNSFLGEKAYYEKRITKLKAGKLSKSEIESIPTSQQEEYIKRELEDWNRLLEEVNQKIAKLKAKTPEFNDITLTDKEAMYMFEEYVKVLTEQLYKVDKNGKILHADIHPGNIFIDVEALKTRKGKVFTLIDTGNTIQLSKEQGMRMSRLSQYIERGDAVDIAEYMLEGANLSASGLTKEQAKEKIIQELKQRFHDNTTELGLITNDRMFEMVTGIMKKHKIIPASDQLNLEKAKTSAHQSYMELKYMWYNKTGEKLNKTNSKLGAATKAASAFKDMIKVENLYNKAQKKQQQLNLLQLSPVERLRYEKNPNLPATNSEEYLTYKLKQKVRNY